MRFFENGPNIPDELLFARDEGRVVFFCGAGVSRARAGLPDFFGLADKVIQSLGVPEDSPACKLLNEAMEIDKRIGINGLLSADQIFGLLDRDYDVSDIESAVAKALKPEKDADLSAHRLLLNLATTPQGKVRLVTTNFDRLFDDCDTSLHAFPPSRLPNPSRHIEMDGIIYLHGCARNDYSGSEQDGFILSSADFGRAYLSEAWATKFFKEIIDLYSVVFVGYAADDPPVRYLLEALNKKEGQLKGVYAFQSGETSEAVARWSHKGVQAIPYAEDNGHKELWETIEAWAVRAKSPSDWYQSVIDLAKQGPRKLQAYQRGQVAHVISTYEGVQKFSDGDSPPPAEWLFVFDPNRRFAKPGYLGNFGNRGEFVDPFVLYGIDSDSVPNKILPDDYYTKREIPANAWNAFVANRLDLQNYLQGDNLSVWSRTTILPSRLFQLGIWISKIAHQPTAIWWAVQQNSLHPDIQQLIQQFLENSQNSVSSIIYQSWKYLFESWKHNIHDESCDQDDLIVMIKTIGWNSEVIRKYASINQPYLKARESFWSAPIPHDEAIEFQLNDLLNLDVEYPSLWIDINIPNEWLALTVRQLRHNLEYALLLETEIGGYGLNFTSPIVADDDKTVDHAQRNQDLSGYVITFALHFERLINLDVTKARQEFAAWPIDDDTIFCRLRIWASGFPELIDTENFANIIDQLKNTVFWNIYHQRDLLLALAKRWNELQDDRKKAIETKLLLEGEEWSFEGEHDYKKNKARESLNRITWMAKQGCIFTFDLNVITENLKLNVPEWNPEDAMDSVRSTQQRGGWVGTDTDDSSLLDEPLSAILSTALELSGRSTDFLTKKSPFAGLSIHKPVRALSSLTDASRKNEYPQWAWEIFLHSDSRNNDKPKLSALIAERLCRCPDEALVNIIHPISFWLMKVSKQLALQCQSSFENLILKLVGFFHKMPLNAGTSIIGSNTQTDWIDKAINSPVGNIAQVLFDDSRLEGIGRESGFPREWLCYAEDLLSLKADLRRYVIVIFCHNFNWLYYIDPNWTELNLLQILDKNNLDDRDAFWSGYLWGIKAQPRPKVALRLKPHLLEIAEAKSEFKSNHSHVLAKIVFALWSSRNEETQERFISHTEMRDVLLNSNEDFRTNILGQLVEWSNMENGDGNQVCADRLLEFIRDVWPLQKRIKTAAISSKLCAILFSNKQCFYQLVEIVVPLLTIIDTQRLLLPSFENLIEIIDLYPSKVLDVFYTILGDKVFYWPRVIDKILQRIGEADTNLQSDERLLELNRKWNSR